MKSNLRARRGGAGWVTPALREPGDAGQRTHRSKAALHAAAIDEEVAALLAMEQEATSSRVRVELRDRPLVEAVPKNDTSGPLGRSSAR